MSIMLPVELARFLQMVGFEWPEGDEDRVFAYGKDWMGFGPSLDAAAALGNSAARTVAGENTGPGVDAFIDVFTKPGGPQDTARSLSLGVTVGGGVITVISAAIVALKVVVVVQLVQFAITVAEAIAAAVPTAGASMSLVPIAKVIAQVGINLAINLALETLLGGA